MGRLTDIKLATDCTENVPPGWMTTVQWAAEEGKSIPRTSAIIRELVRAGHVESRNFVVQAGSRVLPVPHYRLVADNKK
jgi:hypothetical protein